MAAFAALFTASSSLAMLQNARPAMADQNWNRGSHLQRVDRDDRHPKHAHKGKHNGWYKNPHNPHNAYHPGGKPRHDPVRDRR